MYISYQRITLVYDFKARNSVNIFQMVVLFYDKKEYRTESKVLSLSTQGELKRGNFRSYIGQKTKAKKKKKELNQSYQECNVGRVKKRKRQKLYWLENESQKKKN